MHFDKLDSEESIIMIRDWRKALRTPPSYRVGNSRLRIQTHFLTVVIIIGVIIVVLLYASSSRNGKKIINYGFNSNYHFIEPVVKNKYSIPYKDFYNSTYPLSPPVSNHLGIKYRIGIISDLDKKSKSETEPHTWISYFKKGYFNWDPSKKEASVTWDDTPPVVLKTRYCEKGRGMELSELIVFNGKLLTFDDRTGIVYEIDGDSAIPWVILMDGNGRTSKGFKSEWATVKDHTLFVGSMGKEWTSSTGEFENNNPMWVKTVSIHGEVQHHDWHKKYQDIRHSVGVEFPGYMIHESGIWSSIHGKWFFLPRRMSKKIYNDDTDEHMSTNLLLIADDNFENIKVKYIGEVIATHGFSSFKFVPGTKDSVIVALKSEEDGNLAATYIVVFDIDGNILLPEKKIADMKFEGIEFI